MGIISAKTVTEIRQDVITGGKINILTVSLTYWRWFARLHKLAKKNKPFFVIYYVGMEKEDIEQNIFKIKYLRLFLK